MAAHRCHTCGATFTAWATAQRHADSERHHRLDLVLSIDEGSPMGRNDNRKIRRDRRQGEQRLGPPRPNTVQATPTNEPIRRGNK